MQETSSSISVQRLLRDMPVSTIRAFLDQKKLPLNPTTVVPLDVWNEFAQQRNSLPYPAKSLSMVLKCAESTCSSVLRVPQRACTPQEIVSSATRAGWLAFPLKAIWIFKCPRCVDAAFTVDDYSIEKHVGEDKYAVL